MVFLDWARNSKHWSQTSYCPKSALNSQYNASKDYQNQNQHSLPFWWDLNHKVNFPPRYFWITFDYMLMSRFYQSRCIELDQALNLCLHYGIKLFYHLDHNKAIYHVTWKSLGRPWQILAIQSAKLVWKYCIKCNKNPMISLILLNNLLIFRF